MTPIPRLVRDRDLGRGNRELACETHELTVET